MLTAGYYYTLKVNRESDFGLYLIDEDGSEVLLPNRYVTPENKIDDMIDVFVYFDSEDRIVATTEEPYATVGQAAYLKVLDKTVHGVFLDWGIPAKDLFLPNRNQLAKMEVGKSYVVYLYTDNVTGRIVATSRLNGFINNDELTISPRQEVEILLASYSPIGYRVVINNLHWGMLYRNQIFRPVSVGDRMTAYVTQITDDKRVDVSIQQQGYDEVKRSADKIVTLLEKNGGRLTLSDSSTPEEIYKMTMMSKKVFKRIVGYLLKNSIIKMEGNSISLIEKK